jgi:large subunit ribosomal protein L21
VAEGDVLEIDRVEAKAGDALTLRPILLVDGETVTVAADELAKVTVTAEVLTETKGPKIRIIKFKNKTGYRKRQGHRQRHTQVKITGIK